MWIAEINFLLNRFEVQASVGKITWGLLQQACEKLKVHRPSESRLGKAERRGRAAFTNVMGMLVAWDDQPQGMNALPS